jgi:hypothetical protein
MKDAGSKQASKRHAVYLRQEGVGRTDWEDPAITRRGKFSIPVPQSEEGSTFRVRAKPNNHDYRVNYRCKGDESRRFTLPPAS